MPGVTVAAKSMAPLTPAGSCSVVGVAETSVMRIGPSATATAAGADKIAEVSRNAATAVIDATALRKGCSKRSGQSQACLAARGTSCQRVASLEACLVLTRDA